ncbi:hypothetical protein MJO28_014854 [Puccinia striiformis f. sp. tritici]|uniref:Uncharacterized protein n=1 Tax=Puccinia striiformis f. sp. tritici TaxID=168172 RepID=A0ACC0DSC9_9BASI|nr:hypothetical protein Pst134EA_027734 [Puccinia striiformis f. sp. tritici]KAH9442031.1 hypothetical protein Pst134EB_028304 [Puccinia striiformis f. sp. tritici]KAH9448423.1 hypothetical protein Pst134EA_027734 [Puccinia striiformis f. sp. tritici]KAI7937331.1 hypothetical protein MJO29_014646 [Puccinia striiformis f. sp. tritici]KAI7937934.1 hypothetical protein MJO28_014854 [Puccinia striiformis f. sp. tritici]
MDSLTRDSIPPTSLPVTHSSVAYPHNVACATDYHEGYRKSSGGVTPNVEIGQYYWPTNSANPPYERTQLSLPVAPSSGRPPLPYLRDTTVNQQNPRPTSSSSLESGPKNQDERELSIAHPVAYSIDYGYANTTSNTRPYTSTTSSENEVQPYHHAPSRRPSNMQNRAGSNGQHELELPSISNPLTPDSRYSADENRIRREDYAEDLSRADFEKPELSESEHSPQSKSGPGKKPSSLKVSEKRRQQNRAAQRAMRERRKRAAQHQESHMSAIMTENVILREKVSYLSNILLSHAINPGAQFPWNQAPARENPPTMLPPLNTDHLSARAGPVADHNSSLSISPSLVSGQAMFQPTNMPPSSAFASAHGPMLNYYAPGHMEAESHQQGNNAMGLRLFSGPSSNSNLSRPGTAEEAGSRAAAIYRWQNMTSNEGVRFQTESSITAGMGHYGLAGSIDSCSTIPSPTHTDEHPVDSIPANI